MFCFISNQLFATDYNIKLTAVNASNYIFNSDGLGFLNENDPTVNVKVGDKLIFDVSDVADNNHPLAIVSDLVNGGYDQTKEVSGVINNGERGVNEVIWDLAGVTPGDYWYICVEHPNMKGIIRVTAVTTGTDTDGDGVTDDVDVDDDNDGILDEYEDAGPGPDGIQGTDDDADYDLDGVPNRLEIDSDKDGCYDVEEAGYGDLDVPSDGRVGTSDNSIDSETGKVNVEGEYYTLDDIYDLDNNGVKDYLEPGSTLSKTLDPPSVKVLEFSKVTFTGGGATVDNLGTITYSWKITEDKDNSDVWKDIDLYIAENPSHPGIYSGMNTNELVIDSVTAAMDNFGYRLDMETPAFQCDKLVSTAAAKLSVFKLDSDNDNVPDEIDLDDDNDGILDTYEGAGPDGIVGTEDDDDYDGDGVPNRLEIDSDKDGCNDVIESGLDITNDKNNDGQVGLPLEVDDKDELRQLELVLILMFMANQQISMETIYDFLEEVVQQL